MSTLYTTNQYLTDQVATARLRTAYASEDPAKIRDAERWYRDLDYVKDRVEFTPIVFNPLKRSWVTRMRSIGRNWRQDFDILFGTKTLLMMVQKNIRYLENDELMKNVRNPGMYVSKATNTIFLIHPENATPEEILALSGCYFTDKEYIVAGRRDYIDIDCPVVAGRFMLVRVNTEPFEQPKEEEEIVIAPQSESLSNEKTPEAEGQEEPTEKPQNNKKNKK